MTWMETVWLILSYLISFKPNEVTNWSCHSVNETSGIHLKNISLIICPDDLMNWWLRRWLSSARLAVTVCCSSSKLTGRGSPLFRGSRLCRCRAENRLQTRWWRSPHHHSSLNKNTEKRTRDKVTFIHYWGDYYEQVSLFDCSLISSFFVQFIRQSLSRSLLFFQTVSS